MKTITILALAGGMLALGACATPMRRDQIVTSGSLCMPVRFDIYFREGEARLTDAADQAIDAAAGVLRTCDVRTIQVVGLADATGASEANMSLSQRRARTVAQALNAAGLPSPVFDVGAAGDAGATTAGGAAEPLRRRTEVIVDAHPRR
ncbi:MAG: OmpA family protein [Brevundimonas sp.]|jgi:outer membrane protein OmpA-like peptidoglycan-associated protein|uniref:OmpA family protein n=1 Tax=Brevundimonas sp. TaxID=1871086 RepID=UPI00271DFB6F|nr:OmpA family protein [Brevundimonas sp.]MDO9609231.1 OmpA family protein [Brevundimonas sp.]